MTSVIITLFVTAAAISIAGAIKQYMSVNESTHVLRWEHNVDQYGSLKLHKMTPDAYSTLNIGEDRILRREKIT